MVWHDLQLLGVIWFFSSYLALFAVIHLSLTSFTVAWSGFVGLLLFGLAYFGLLPFSVDKFVLVFYHYKFLFIIFLFYNTFMP